MVFIESYRQSIKEDSNRVDSDEIIRYWESELDQAWVTLENPELTEDILLLIKLSGVRARDAKSREVLEAGKQARRLNRLSRAWKSMWRKGIVHIGERFIRGEVDYVNFEFDEIQLKDRIEPGYRITIDHPDMPFLKRPIRVTKLELFSRFPEPQGKHFCNALDDRVIEHQLAV